MKSKIHNMKFDIKKLPMVLLLCVPTHAEETLRTIPVPPALSAYVVESTGYALPVGVMISVVSNDDEILTHHNALAAGIDAVAAAAEKHGQIYLSARYADDLEAAQSKALIVHELTHVAQETNKTPYYCDGQKEAEAYTIQNKFLNDSGLPPAIDAETIVLFRSCKGY